MAKIPELSSDSKVHQLNLLPEEVSFKAAVKKGGIASDKPRLMGEITVKVKDTLIGGEFVRKIPFFTDDGKAAHDIILDSVRHGAFTKEVQGFCANRVIDRKQKKE